MNVSNPCAAIYDNTVHHPLLQKHETANPFIFASGTNVLFYDLFPRVILIFSRYNPLLAVTNINLFETW